MGDGGFYVYNGVVHHSVFDTFLPVPFYLISTDYHWVLPPPPFLPLPRSLLQTPLPISWFVHHLLPAAVPTFYLPGLGLARSTFHST